MSNPSATMWEIETMSANSSPDQFQLRSDVSFIHLNWVCFNENGLKWSQILRHSQPHQAGQKNTTLLNVVAKCRDAMQCMDTRINGSLEFCKQATPDLQSKRKSWSTSSWKTGKSWHPTWLQRSYHWFAGWWLHTPCASWCSSRQALKGVAENIHRPLLATEAPHPKICTVGGSGIDSK